MVGALVDVNLINELYEDIARNPPALEARKILILQLTEFGWIDAARDNAEELLKLDPLCEEAGNWLAAHPKPVLPPPEPPIRAPPKAPQLTPKRAVVRNPTISLSKAEIDAATLELTIRLAALKARAEELQKQSNILREDIIPKADRSLSDRHLANQQLIVDGRLPTVLRVRPPCSARAVAKAIKRSPGEAEKTLYSDLEDYIRWLRSPSNPEPLTDNEKIRSLVFTRARSIKAELSEDQQLLSDMVLAQADRSLLGKTYANDETMYGDDVKDIPRENFLCTEDNYAWDMEELTQAIKSNGGIMRNPLSKQLFSVNDVKAILAHPLGDGLRVLQLEQKLLSKGVRDDTITELETLSKVLLADMSDDQLASREAVEKFLLHVATLPKEEQKALDVLRVPAVDTHTGAEFDTSIGDAVRDARGNRICFHKTGDLLRQAATHLKSQKEKG